MRQYSSLALEKFLKLLLFSGLSLAILGNSLAGNLPVTATIGADQVQKASIAPDHVADPTLISILALSVATITLVRRRERH